MLGIAGSEHEGVSWGGAPGIENATVGVPAQVSQMRGCAQSGML